jgi:glycerol dehydrogenase
MGQFLYNQVVARFLGGLTKMSVINLPGLYENAPGVLSYIGKWINHIGHSALLITGEQALKAVREKLFASLNDNDSKYAVEIFSGYPTATKIQNYVKLAIKMNIDVVVGIGGGRVLDCSKLVALKTGIPIVAVPTIASTCAAWTPLTVLYAENGAQEEYVPLERSPSLIVVDMEILKKAPLRYLHSGVADSFAKWYEQAYNLKGNERNFELRLKMKASELSLEFLDDYVNAYKNDSSAVSEEILENTIDSILMLIGLVGSINGKIPNGGLAHPFYEQFTKVRTSTVCLHGEIVAFGLTMQFILENRDETFIAGHCLKMKVMGIPLTLRGLGLTENLENNVKIIASKIHELSSNFNSDGREFLPGVIEKAIWRADELGSSLERN